MERNTGRSTRAPAPAAVSHEMVAKRAYEIWCERGRPFGQELTHWLEAESQLSVSAPRAKTKATRSRGAKAVDPA